MGLRGPPKKATKLKKLEGTFRPDRALPGEPDPVVSVPTAPDVVVADDDARKEWQRITAELEPLGLISQMDLVALALYCVAWGRWLKAERSCAFLGDVFTPKGLDDGAIGTGKLTVNPWRAVADKAHDRAKQALGLFGMSPADRTRISVDASNAANPHKKAEGFLFGARGEKAG